MYRYSSEYSRLTEVGQTTVTILAPEGLCVLCRYQFRTPRLRELCQSLLDLLLCAARMKRPSGFLNKKMAGLPERKGKGWLAKRPPEKE
jgi:hypothetical protein